MAHLSVDKLTSGNQKPGAAVHSWSEVRSLGQMARVPTIGVFCDLEMHCGRHKNPTHRTVLSSPKTWPGLDTKSANVWGTRLLDYLQDSDTTHPC